MASRSVLVTKGKRVWGASRLHHYCVRGEVACVGKQSAGSVHTRLTSQ